MNQNFVQEIVKIPQQPKPEQFSISNFLRLLRPAKRKVRSLFGPLPSAGFTSPSIEQDLYAFLRNVPTGAVRCEISVTGQTREFSPAVRQQINMIAREALVNALEHSKATSIEAEIEYSAQRLRVIVRDNGCGIDRDQANTRRNSPVGLSGMRKQANRMGAQLTIWSSPGAGTEVEICVPKQVLVEVCA